MREIIDTMEELALNAWPSVQSLHYDGWLLRFSGGYTRRANSVNVLYASTLDLSHKIAYCEQQYRARNQKTVFKLTPETEPAELDQRLADRGYAAEGHVSVQGVALSALTAPSHPIGSFVNLPLERWIPVYCELRDVERHHIPTMTTMLHNIVPATCFGAVVCDDEVVAMGLGVAERAHVGLFDIVTAPALRRQGFGRFLVESLLHWGTLNNAQYAYLQVLTENIPARRLYAELGFTELYPYWYRAAPNSISRQPAESVSRP